MGHTSLSLALSKISKMKSEKTAQETTLAFKQYLDKSKILNVILQSENYSDGIGDFKNLIDYYLWMEEIFQDFPKVSIKAFAYVCKKKSPTCRKILPKKLIKNNVCYYHDINEEWYVERAKKAKIIIFTGYENKLRKCFLKTLVPIHIKTAIHKNSDLLSFVKKTQFLLNIATPLEDSLSILKDELPVNCFIHSRLEYDIYPPSSKENGYTEDHMGINSIGLKFDEKLHKLQTTSRTSSENGKLLLQLTNKTLLKRLLGAKEDDELTEMRAEYYLKQIPFNFAYLQSSNAIEEYIKLIVVLEKEKMVTDIIINQKFFRATNEMINFLKSKGISKLQLIKNNGDCQKTLFYDTEKKPHLLRLIEFSGTSVEDKKIFSTLSNITGASGDNSFSDIFGLPFFYLPSWKEDFMKSFIDYIKAQTDIKGSRILYQYLQTLEEKKQEKVNCEIHKIFSIFKPLHVYTKKNKKVIRDSFCSIKKRIHETKNAKIAFYKLIHNFILNRLAQEDKKENKLDNKTTLVFK